MNIELREITMANFHLCLDLTVDESQKNFVAKNIYSLAEAKADGVSETWAIYHGETMVGFVMYDFDCAANMGWINRLMIDKKYQGKGYGRKAMEIALKNLKANEGCKKIQTSFEPHNSVAKSLYLSLGFKLTGEQVDGEDICVLVNDAGAEPDEKYKGGDQVTKIMDKDVVKKIHMEYLLFLPKDFSYTKKWPLVIFLHGAGERGNDLELVKKHGPPMQVENGMDLPFILVSPQCPEYLWWNDKTREVKEIINDVSGLYPIETDRIYITGLSMGGYGTFKMVEEYPELFAAAIPICGGMRNHEDWEKAKDVPFWIFHGDKDKSVPVDMSKKAADLINASGGSAKLTIYPGVEHNSWTRTYDNPEVYKWMLKQRR